MQLLIPRTYDDDRKPVTTIYLAGPITNAPRWHMDAVRLLEAMVPARRQLRVACGNRYVQGAFRHLLAPGSRHAATDAEWGQHYQLQARQQGCVLFWLPTPDSSSDPSHDPAKAYGATSRMELGQEMLYSHASGRLSFVLGMEKQFPEDARIRHDMAHYHPTERIFDDLQQACARAVDIAFASEDRGND